MKNKNTVVKTTKPKIKIKLTPEQKLEVLKAKQTQRDRLAQDAKKAFNNLKKDIESNKAKAKKALDDERRKEIISIFNKYGALSVSCLDIEEWLKSKGFLPLPSKKGSKAADSAIKTEKSAAPDIQEEFF